MPKEPLYPHVPRGKQPLFPHVPKGQQPAEKLPQTLPQTGTCYQDAWRFLIKEGEGHLVHGTVWSKDKRISHAWVETETGYIWEPETKEFYTKLGFKDAASPIEEHRYTPTEAAIMAARTKNFGPWTHDEVLNYLKRKVPAVIPTKPRFPATTEKLSRHDVEVYLSLPPYKAIIWVENKKTGKTIWKLEGAENINRFGWKDQNRDQLEESALRHLEDIGVLSGGMTSDSLELLASTEGDPIKKFCCRLCGECAPKDLLEEGKFLDRISWLRSHYKENHPGMWGKMSPMTVKDGEPVSPEYRHLASLVSEPLPKEAE